MTHFMGLLELLKTGLLMRSPSDPEYWWDACGMDFGLCCLVSVPDGSCGHETELNPWGRRGVGALNLGGLVGRGPEVSECQGGVRWFLSRAR